jgi:hypothetical protein
MASSTATIELELQPVQERSKSNEQEFRQITPGSLANTDGPGPHLESSSAELQQQPAVVAHALEKWNDPIVNIYRIFATFWAFIIMGANDAAYGVSAFLPLSHMANKNYRL